ncbi:MAG: hypothetical protein IJ864_01360 [Alphaproteobacteria bacterium]|nr:hypothetical protein [Alphaproteobacteria bacterium]
MSDKKYYTSKNGKKYAVEVGKIVQDINAAWPEQQFFTINGDTVVLRSSYAENDNNKRAMELVVVSQNAQLEVEDIYAIFECRARVGQASSMEKAAMYQLKYKEMARAEAKARGLGDRNIDNVAILTQKQIMGREALPDLKRKFPWAYATPEQIASDKKWQNIPILGRTAELNEKCRQQLQEVRKNRGFDYMDVLEDTNQIFRSDLLSEHRKQSQKQDLAMQATVAQKITDKQLEDLNSSPIPTSAKENEAKNSSQVSADQMIKQNSGRDMG